MSKFTNSAAEAQQALNAGYWVSVNTPFGDWFLDALSQATFEIHDDWSKKASSPRLGAIHKNDKSGGFKNGMRVRLSENATHRTWTAGCEKIVKHPAAGKAGTVEFVTDAENLVVSVVFDDVKDADQKPVAMLVPGDWLRLAMPSRRYVACAEDKDGRRRTLGKVTAECISAAFRIAEEAFAWDDDEWFYVEEI